MRRLILPALLLAFHPAARADQTDDYVLSQLKQQRIPAVSIAVVRNGEPIKLQGYGLVDLENNVPASPDSVYLLASVTKQFTATAIMMLAQDGKIELDEKIGKYVDGAPEAWNGVTVRRLLTHTNGLPREVPFDRSPGWFVADHTPQEFMKAAAARELSFPPGEKFSYSNAGYWLLGYTVEKVSGKSYGDFLRERIFEPLGMRSTRLSDPKAVIPNRAAAYTLQNGGFANVPHPTPLAGGGAGCLISTARDMARWDAALYTEKLLPREALMQMWTPGKLNNGTVTGYGFGWTLGDYRGHRVISHNGGFVGAATQITRFVDDKLTVIVLANRDQANVTAMANAIAGFFEPGLGSLRSIEARPDTDPARTTRLKRVLTDIGNGAESPDLTPEAKASLKAGAPWVQRMGPMLKRLEDFKLIACEAPKTRSLERNGSGIESLCYYRMQIAGRQVEWTFYLTAAGKVADLQPQRE